jgi:hypothetical protein
MKTKFLGLAILSLSILLLSCEKIQLKSKNGTYKGTFTVTYNNGIVRAGETTLELKNGEFSCSKNSNRVPAGGSGTFSINENEITFTDENAWTADFDWNLILEGTYNCEFQGKKLIISADKNGLGHYKYELEKQ